MSQQCLEEKEILSTPSAIMREQMAHETASPILSVLKAFGFFPTILCERMLGISASLHVGNHEAPDSVSKANKLLKPI